MLYYISYIERCASISDSYIGQPQWENDKRFVHLENDYYCLHKITTFGHDMLIRLYPPEKNLWNKLWKMLFT